MLEKIYAAGRVRSGGPARAGRRRARILAGAAPAVAAAALALAACGGPAASSGGTGSASFNVTVANKNPVVTTPNGNQSILEGNSVSFADLATFTDAGFDNPANPNPAVPPNINGPSCDWRRVPVRSRAHFGRAVNAASC